MKEWLLDIANEHYFHLKAFIQAREFNLAMRRAAKECANAKAHLGNSDWHVYELREMQK